VFLHFFDSFQSFSSKYLIIFSIIYLVNYLKISVLLNNLLLISSSHLLLYFQNFDCFFLDFLFIFLIIFIGCLHLYLVFFRNHQLFFSFLLLTFVE